MKMNKKTILPFFSSLFVTNFWSHSAKLARATSVHQILKLCDEFFPGDPQEFFFDRNPQNLRY